MLRRVGMDFLPDPVGTPVLCHVEIITALQVHPELRRRAEVAGQPDRRIGGDRPLAVHDLVDSPRGDFFPFVTSCLREANMLYNRFIK